MTQISLQDGPIPAPVHPLVARLAALRGRVRTAVGLFGVGVVLGAAIGVLFALMLLDYLIHIPAPLRLALLIAWIIGVAVLAWRKLFAPLSTRLTDQFLASRVELLHPQLSDELISAVHFIHARAAASNALAARQIDLAATRTQSIPFEDALDFHPAGKSLGIAFLITLIAGIVGFSEPALAKVALSRWLSASPMAWPMSTHVAFDWSGYGGQPPKVIPLGEKFTVRAKVDKGSPARVWLHQWSDNSHTVSQIMTHQKEQDGGGLRYYEAAFEPQGNTLSLRIEAGDDHEESPLTIALAARPAILDLRGVIAAPPYVKNVQNPAETASAVLVNLMSQSGRATEGSQITLHVRASKRIGSDAGGLPQIAFYDQNQDQPLGVSMDRKFTTGSLGNEADIRITAKKTLQARVVITDTDGFQNRIGGAFSIEVVPDAMPAVVITEPRRSVERAPNGVVDLTIQATDDWGFRGLKLQADKFDAKAGDPPAFSADLPLGELTSDPAVGSISAKTPYTWDLSALNLQPGTRLSFYAMVQDNYEVDGKQHDWVKSSPLSLTIKSASDIQEEQRKALAELNERLKGLKLQQEQTRAQTESIRTMVATSGVLSQQQIEQLAGLSQQQVQEAATAAMIQQSAAQAADELRQNKMGEGELGKIAQDVAGGMQDVSRQNMPRAAAALSQAQQPGSNQNPGQPAGSPPGSPPGGSPASPSGSPSQQSAQSMASAAGQQQQAISEMDKLIQQLGATGDFESLRDDTRKLLEKQQAATTDTLKIAPEAEGAKPENLPPNIKNQENQLAKSQKQLQDQTVDLLNRMKQAVQSLKESDPGSSQSLQAAADAGAGGQVSQNQGQAGDEISQNQLSDAKNNQTTAQQGLQSMMDELNKNDLRRLEQLARDIRRLIDDVQKIRDDQAALQKDTGDAGAAAVSALLQKLANRQGSLQLNTIIVEKKAQSTPRVAQAAQYIGEASDHMVESATALYSNKQADSVKPEADAIASLDAALAELKKVDQQISPDVKNKQLAAYIKEYEAIKKDQTAVKGTSDNMETQLEQSPDHVLGHQSQLRLGEVAKTQSGLADRINTLSRDDQLKAIEVIVWMNQQVTDAMTDSRQKLEKEQIGPPLASAQQTALDRIQMIIDALKEEQSQPEFNGGGGGGGGGGGKPPLVPPVAQLRLLKAMQVVVNTQTKGVDQSLKTAANDADKNEYQMQAAQLGSKQDQIHSIADRLVQQLKPPGQ